MPEKIHFAGQGGHAFTRRFSRGAEKADFYLGTSRLFSHKFL
jgi:hypothetical protein